MTVAIPPKKLSEVLQECKKWTGRTRANKKALQSLVGKLVHLANCIPHARKFTGRLLATLRTLNQRVWTTLTPDARLDISWFLHYAELGNGISLLTYEKEVFEIECDACLQGGGGHSQEAFYKWKFTEEHAKTYHTIHALEALNLLVAFKTLAPSPVTAQINVHLYTDNMASSYALMTGKTKDAVLGACARQLWLEATKKNLDFTIIHKPGIDIPLADALSRYFTDDLKADYADQQIAARKLSERSPVLEGYNFFDRAL